jgi:L-rhamnose mutarotase
MARIAFKMFLYPGSVAEYRRRHDEIWPELSVLLKAHGISDYSIFLDEEKLELFAVLTAADPKIFDTLPQNAHMQRWWNYMKDLMHTNADNSPKTSPLTEVFYLP